MLNTIHRTLINQSVGEIGLTGIVSTRILSVLWRFRWYPSTVNSPFAGIVQENIKVEEFIGVHARLVGSSKNGGFNMKKINIFKAIIFY